MLKADIMLPGNICSPVLHGFLLQDSLQRFHCFIHNNRFGGIAHNPFQDRDLQRNNRREENESTQQLHGTVRSAESNDDRRNQGIQS